MMYVRHESNIAKMKISKVLVDIRTLSVDVARYKADNGVYPSTSQGLAALLRKPGSGPAPGNFPDDGYRKSMPLDPWDRPYQYRYPGEHKDFDIYTLGADGVPGGTGLDMDAGNWNLEEFAKAIE
ncbi:type II secretion system major pseudopilin GspG [Thermodesulfobacteriota bacterium]